MKVSFLTLIFISLSMLASCANREAVGPDYYLLGSSDLTDKSLQLKSFKLAIGPIEVPIHLDREGIVTHESQNKLTYSDRHRWAEPLEQNLTKTLHANLAQLLPNQQLIDFPYKQSNRPDYQLIVSIDKFGYLSEGKVVLLARSSIVNSKGKQLDSSYIKLERSGIEKNHAQIVSAMSSLLRQMAVELAAKFSGEV